MSLANFAARGAAFTYGAQGVRVLVQVGSIVVLARLLTPGEYGAVTMVVSIVGIATVFGDLGLSMAAMQSQTLTQQQRSNLLWINMSLGILLSVLIVCTSPAIAGFYGKQELAPIGSALSVVFFLYSITPQLRAELASKLRYRWLATADVVAQVAGFVVAVVTAIAGFGYWSLVWNQIVVAAVTALLVSVGAHWRPNLPRRTPGMVPLLRYGVDTLGVQLLTYISGNVDNVLIGRFIGSGALGLYSRAAQLFRLPLQQIATPLTPVAVPVLSRLSATIDVFEAYARRAQLALAYSLGGVLFGFVAAAGPIVSIALGAQWSSAVPLLQILAVGGVFQAFGYVYYWIFLSSGFTALQLKWSLIGRAIMVVMLIASVPFGITGIAIAASAGQVLLWAINSFVALPKTGVPVRGIVIAALRPAMIFGPYALLAALATPHLPPMPSIVLLLLVGGGMLTALGIAWLVSRRVREDVRVLARTPRLLRG